MPATPSAPAQEQQIATDMQAARAAEYLLVIEEATVARHGSDADRARAQRRLRGELHRITRRDFFPPLQRETATQAVHALAAGATPFDMRGADLSHHGDDCTFETAGRCCSTARPPDPSSAGPVPPPDPYLRLICSSARAAPEHRDDRH
ncbi:chromate resistance protein ChrB domain-containing protein [Actinoplanes sp. CA-252034]|uniref:chromate resistance protein ChrB domain-containing protein n=1 Tax=Actinoplanes sp. CA-252034 TaxID=3239906 RepID=UPI003D999E8A